MEVTYSAATDPGGENADTRGKDIDTRAVVGEGSQAVGAVSSANGEDGGLRGGRVVCSIAAIVTSSNSHENTSGDSVGGSGVDSSRFATTKRHVGNSAVGAAAGLSVVGDEVDTGNDARVGARAAGIENLDSVQLSLLSYTVALGTNGTSAVGAVT